MQKMTIEDKLRDATSASHCGSPNNVKGIYLSPYGAIITYHVKYSSINPVERIAFQPKDWDNHTNISEVVVEPVLSSLEELVIIPMGMENFAQVIFDPNILLKGYTGKRGNLVADIKKRYKRLRGIFLLKQGNIGDVWNLLHEKGYRGINHAFKPDQLDCQMFRGDEYWKEWGSAAQYYSLDREGSPLNVYFKAVRTAYENREKKQKSKEKASDRIKRLRESYERLRTRYNHLLMRLCKTSYGVFNIDTASIKKLAVTAKADELVSEQAIKKEKAVIEKNTITLLRMLSDSIDNVVDNETIKPAYKLACERSNLYFFDKHKRIKTQLKNQDKVNLTLLTRFVDFVTSEEVS